MADAEAATQSAFRTAELDATDDIATSVPDVSAVALDSEMDSLNGYDAGYCRTGTA